jgi:hypothetical protein
VGHGEDQGPLRHLHLGAIGAMVWERAHRVPSSGLGIGSSGMRQSKRAESNVVKKGSVMTILKISDLRSVTIKVLPSKKRVRLRFSDLGAAKYESIEIEVASILALGFATEILKLLPRGNTPKPASRASMGGRPKLRLVKDTKSKAEPKKQTL